MLALQHELPCLPANQPVDFLLPAHDTGTEVFDRELISARAQKDATQHETEAALQMRLAVRERQCRSPRTAERVWMRSTGSMP